MNYFAVLNSQLNKNKKLIAIGIVIANKENFEPVDYFNAVITPEFKMVSRSGQLLFLEEFENITIILSKNDAIKKMNEFLDKYEIKDVCALHATYECKNLPEIKERQVYNCCHVLTNSSYNKSIEKHFGHKVSNINISLKQLLSWIDKDYVALHNVLQDSIDTLKIMKYIGRDFDVYKQFPYKLSNKKKEIESLNFESNKNIDAQKTEKPNSIDRDLIKLKTSIFELIESRKEIEKEDNYKTIYAIIIINISIIILIILVVLLLK